MVKLLAAALQASDYSNGLLYLSAMLRFFYLLAGAACLCIMACSDEGTEQTTKTTAPVYEHFKTGVLNDIKSKTDPVIQYSLYIPDGYTPAAKIPLVFLLDAHSRTHTSIMQYKTLCNKLHVAMICSGNSKNGLEASVTNLIVQKTLDDILSRLHCDSNKVYLAGFSGGARVSGSAAAIDSRVKGVVASAAGFQAEEARNIPYVLIAGIKDMNSTELFALHQNLKTPNAFILWDGIHTWPPDSIMQRAFKAMLENNVTALNNDALVNATFTPAALKKEEAEKQALQKLFANNNWDALLTAVNQIKQMIATASQPDEKALQQRLLATCGMYCFFAVPKAPDMVKALKVYEAADPQNPDMWFFKAGYYAATDKNAAHTFLHTAAEKGFFDMDRLNNDPNLKELANDEIRSLIQANN